MPFKDLISQRLLGRKRGSRSNKIPLVSSTISPLLDQPESEVVGSGEPLASGFGLFLLNPNGSGTASDNRSHDVYDVDIIAVHGLGGDAYRTWTHENGKLWLRDFAPEALPGARIFSYGYDSAFVFSHGTGTVRDFSRGLLENIRLARTSLDVGGFNSSSQQSST